MEGREPDILCKVCQLVMVLRTECMYSEYRWRHGHMTGPGHICENSTAPWDSTFLRPFLLQSQDGNGYSAWASMCHLQKGQTLSLYQAALTATQNVCRSSLAVVIVQHVPNVPETLRAWLQCACGFACDTQSPSCAMTRTACNT